MRKLTAMAGMDIHPVTGLAAYGVPGRMATPFFCRAAAGDSLKLLDTAYLFSVAAYSPRIDETYIYTYAYQPDENWASYNRALSQTAYRQADYVFPEPAYFRVCLKRADGAAISGAQASAIGGILAFIPGAAHAECAAAPPPPFILQEAESTARRIAEKQTPEALRFALLTDTHITVNGTWPHTLAALKAVHKRVGFNGVIHLGDITDGMTPAAVTREYVTEAKNALASLGAPLYVALGNHDTNSFKGNPEPFSVEEQCGLYLSHADSYTVRESGNQWYYKDFPGHGLRLLFLASFNHREKYRYGFSDDCVAWTEQTLRDMPAGYKAIVFSHLTPLVKLQAWVDTIRNGAGLAARLEAFNTASGGRLLAYINGHNHTDQIYRGLSFPIVSIGCAKIEYFKEYKPEGSYTPPRRLGDRTQELWDTLLVTPRENRLEFIRFGAGEDRLL